ncbi:DUF6323 family protein [Candidatus Enterococcus clewellii]|uniref:Uncharacterized protein n=1 Tax=Candidatus Enterococcus clewellii TaxID=1834193 RepID=A0AAQ3W2B9_9ENTE|nr:DUF6323 family protein [Enterococcus sp. 9E7_DIV0242]
MKYDMVSLFNELQDQNGISLNQVIQRQELHLSELQLQELAVKREESLEANHLIDLSSDSQRYIATQLDQSTLTTTKNYFQHLIDLQESFYFLRSNLPFSYSDEELLEKLIATFEKYEGSISPMQGALEEWLIEENLKGGTLDDGIDNSLGKK